MEIDLRHRSEPMIRVSGHGRLGNREEGAAEAIADGMNFLPRSYGSNGISQKLRTACDAHHDPSQRVRQATAVAGVAG